MFFLHLFVRGCAQLAGIHADAGNDLPSAVADACAI